MFSTLENLLPVGPRTILVFQAHCKAHLSTHEVGGARRLWVGGILLWLLGGKGYLHLLIHICLFIAKDKSPGDIHCEIEITNRCLFYKSKQKMWRVTIISNCTKGKLKDLYLVVTFSLNSVQVGPRVLNYLRQ